MKFNVCGGLDAPDWILAHMSTLSKISSIRIKLLAGHVVSRILEDVFEYEEVVKLSNDSSLGESEVKACIAVLHFFIANAAKFGIDGSTLSKELQQLGLPKEHSDSLCKPYLDNKESLQAKFLEQSLQGEMGIRHVYTWDVGNSDINCATETDEKQRNAEWTSNWQNVFDREVPALKIGGWQVQLGDSKSVVMRLTTADQDKCGPNENTRDLQLCLTAEKFYLLFRELKTAKALMEELL